MSSKDNFPFATDAERAEAHDLMQRKETKRTNVDTAALVNLFLSESL